MAKKDSDELIYSLLNIVNGTLLSGKLNYSWTAYANAKTEQTRRRNFQTSQFDLANLSTLSYFISGELPKLNRWDFGFETIYVKEEDIDDLYFALAYSAMANFANSQEKEKRLFYAFILDYNPELFLSLTVNNYSHIKSFLKKQALGKKFLQFLEEHEILSYTDRGKRVKFSQLEYELISKKKSEVNKIFIQVPHNE